MADFLKKKIICSNQLNRSIHVRYACVYMITVLFTKTRSYALLSTGKYETSYEIKQVTGITTVFQRDLRIFIVYVVKLFAY